MAAGLGLLTAGAGQANDGAAKIDGARAAIEKWAETRALISKEKRDWALGREVLEDRIEVVQQEIDQLRERLQEAEASIADADKQRVELIETNDRYKEASGVLEETVIELEARTGKLLGRLPDPAQERVQLFARRLPDDPNDSKMSLGERFQNVVAIANDVNKFNRQVSVTSEVRSLPDGTTAEVTALYIGLGQGYYVSGDGASAGTGTASAEGWVWTSAPGAAEGVRKAVGILQEGKVAEFVPLPVRID